MEQKEQKNTGIKKGEYIEAVGRRKESIARVRIYVTTSQQSVENKGFLVNDKEAKNYFVTKQRETALAPLERLDALNKFKVSVRVRGGGLTGQSEAVRMGLARALVLFDPELREKLKRAGYLTRDPRKKERKKYGLKKARRAPQWRKR